MNRYDLATEVAWKVISLPLDKAENLIRDNGLNVEVLKPPDDLFSEFSSFTGTVYLVVNDFGKVMAARIG